MQTPFFYSGHIDDADLLKERKLLGKDNQPEYLVGPVAHFPDGSFLGRVQRKWPNTYPLTARDLDSERDFFGPFNSMQAVYATFNKGRTYFELKDIRLDENNLILGLFAPLERTR